MFCTYQVLPSRAFFIVFKAWFRFQINGGVHLHPTHIQAVHHVHLCGSVGDPDPGSETWDPVLFPVHPTHSCRAACPLVRQCFGSGSGIRDLGSGTFSGAPHTFMPCSMYTCAALFWIRIRDPRLGIRCLFRCTSHIHDVQHVHWWLCPDSYPGSVAFLTPGSGIRNRFFPNPGSRTRIPNPYF
jgi:hypothetical protein